MAESQILGSSTKGPVESGSSALRVKFDNVDFGYGSVKVLDDINLEISEPGLVCIIGPNGVGKSTLIKCINRINKPSSGKVSINGYDVNDISLKEMAKVVAYVPVVSSDTFSMTVMDTVLMGRHPHQKMGTASRLDLKIVKRSLKMMGVSHLSMRSFSELSAGQHQKVAVARGLAQTPKLLILDEPTSNLDVRHQIQMTHILQQLAIKNGMTVLMISHDLNIASKFADRIIMMAHPGTIYRTGTPSEVITEDNIRYVYGVDCKVVDDCGRPHVMLGMPMDEEDVEQAFHENIVYDD